METDGPPSISLLELAKEPWLDHADIISGALVYVDRGAAEVLSVTLGAAFLLGLGAQIVCDLETASTDDASLSILSGMPVSALVVATTQLLTEAHPLILRAALAHPHMRTLVVLSAVSEPAHALQPSGELGTEAYNEYASMLQGDVEDGRSAAFAREAASVGGSAPAAPPVGTVTVTVRHLPSLNLCALDDHTFVLPARSSPATAARLGGTAAGMLPTDRSGPTHAPDGSLSSSGGATLLAQSLAALVGQLGARLDAYALGPAAVEVARELVRLPLPAADPSGGTAGSVGVLLLDRSLDLVTPCSHPDHVMDVLLATAPRQGDSAGSTAKPAGHRAAHVHWRPTDARLEADQLQPLRPFPWADHADGKGSDTHPPLYGLELWQPHDKAAAAHVSQLLHKTRKDVSLLARKWLKQGLAAERLAPSSRTRAGAVTPAELLSLAADLTSHTGAGLRQRQAVALALATASSLGGTDSPASPGARWDLAGSLEKQLCGMLLAMGVEEGGPAVCAALRDALATAMPANAPLMPTDVLALLPALHSLALDASPGGIAAPLFTPEDAASLRVAAVSALLQQAQRTQDAAQPAAPAAAAGLAAVLPGWAAAGPRLDAAISEAVDALLRCCNRIMQARASFKDPALRRVTVADVFADNAGTPQPLLRTVLRKGLQGHDLPDLVHVTPDSLGGLLSKGLVKVFGGGAPGLRPVRLTDHSLLLVFVIGGVCLQEIREVVEASKASESLRIVLGGTSLLSPSDVLRQCACRAV